MPRFNDLVGPVYRFTPMYHVLVHRYVSMFWRGRKRIRMRREKEERRKRRKKEKEKVMEEEEDEENRGDKGEEGKKRWECP